MGDVKWIKISTGIFDDEKFDAIRTMPDGNDIQLVWFKLLCLAGKCNEGGLLMITRELPYTDEMLASHFRMDIGVVQRALAIFQRLEMIELVDNIYLVSNWAKHQNTQSMEDMKAKHRETQRRYVERKKQRLLEEQAKDDDVTNDVTNDVIMTEKLSSSNNHSSNNPLSLNSDSNNTNSINIKTDISNSIELIIKAWNELSDIGIKPIRSVSSGSKRNEMLRARIREHGSDTVIEAIGNIRESDFLQGKNNRGWMITFDWFLLPGNFQKVLEGNYDNRNHVPQQEKAELKGSELFMAIAKGEL